MGLLEEVSLALSLDHALQDPYCWLGFCAGGLAAGLPAAACWAFRRRPLRAPEPCEDNESWYDALEDIPTGPNFADELRLHVHTAMSPARSRKPSSAGLLPSQGRGLTQLLGTSLPRRAPEERTGPPLGPGEFHEPSWSHGDAGVLRVRAGPSYLKTGHKERSRPQLYSTAGVDMVTADCRVDAVVPRLCPLAPGGGGWRAKCGVPRVIVFNCQMPFTSGPKLYGPHPPEDHGVSVICQFVASPELLRVANLNASSPAEAAAEPLLPAVRLLQRFVRNNTMDYVGERTGARSSATLKLIGWVEELENVDLPALLRPTVEKYNGKPVLLAGTGTVLQDPDGEWLEIDFDVRDFSWVTRSFLVNLRHKLKGISAQVAAVVQGTEDEELPEVVLATLRFHALDLLAGVRLEDPRADGHDHEV